MSRLPCVGDIWMAGLSGPRSFGMGRCWCFVILHVRTAIDIDMMWLSGPLAGRHEARGVILPSDELICPGAG